MIAFARTCLVLVIAVAAAGCGRPIEAPEAVIDLSLNPAALQQTFDADTGKRRLLLLLSPA